MKKLTALLILCVLLFSAAYAETAQEYCAWLEEVLPDGNFVDAEIPDYCIEKLGKDYDLSARTSDFFGTYVACVRKTPVPEGAKVDAFSGSFDQRIWRVSDGKGGFLYNFALRDSVDIRAYDGLQHLIIAPTGYAPEVFQAASKQRAQIMYANEHSFDFMDDNHAQLAFQIHSYESWKAGATKEPTGFYLNIDEKLDLLGEKSMSLEQAAKYKRADIGLALHIEYDSYNPVISENGMKGVVYGDRLYEAGPDFERLMDIAEEALGYRPGDMDFTGKKIVSAKFEWLAGESMYKGEKYNYGAGSVEVSDKKKLEKLEKMLKKANYMLGGVNCPSSAFMVLELEDGSRSEIAVAVNSFSTFFYHGMCFEFKEGDIIDLFNLKETVFYKAIIGG